MTFHMTLYRAFFVALSTFLLTVAATYPLQAQGEDNPLEFQTEFRRIGGEIGLTSVWQSGEYAVDCGLFKEGGKINPIIALAYDDPIAPGLRFEALLGYQGRSLRSSYNSKELVPIVIAGEERDTIARPEIDFENVGTASFSYVFLLPSVKYYITKGLYVGVGINGGLLLSSTTQYTKTILSKTFPYQGNYLEVYYNEQESSDPYSKVYPEHEINDAVSFGLDGAAYVGFELPFGRKLRVSPRVLYTIPFTPVFENPELKLNTFQLLLGARYILD